MVEVRRRRYIGEREKSWETKRGVGEEGNKKGGVE